MGLYPELDRILDDCASNGATEHSDDTIKNLSLPAYTELIHKLLTRRSSASLNDSQKQSLHLFLARELQSNLRKPAYADCFASALAAVTHESDHVDFQALIESHAVEDFQASMLAVSVLCESSSNSKTQGIATKILVNNFQALLRQIGLRSQRGALSDSDIAHLVNHLLLKQACLKVLSPVQKFVVEYAIFQRYQVDLPHEIHNFFMEYNKSRAQEDSSKSLAQLFEETRGAATTTLSSVEQILIRKHINSSTPKVEIQIADLIVTLVNSAYPAGSWNGERLGTGLHNAVATMDWATIIRDLDREEIQVSNMDDLNLLLSIFRGAIHAGATDVPVHLLWSTWTHTQAQAALLAQLSKAPLSVINITEFRGQKVLSAENFVSAPTNIKNLAAQLETSPWNSLELLQTSLRLLGDDSAAHETKSFLEAAGKTTPELIFLGCIQLPHPWGPQQEQLSEKGCEVFFSGQPNHQLVFYRLWQVDPEFLCRKFVQYHAKDSLSISRILDIAQDLRILDQLLNLQPYAFSIDLAALASRREYLNIDKWLDHHIAAGRDNFIDSCLRFLSFKAEAENLLQQGDASTLPVTVSLRVEIVAIFLKALMNSAMSPENGEYLKQVQSACLQVYPRLMNSTHVERDASNSNSFAKDVEKEVEFYYGRLYEGDMSIANFIEMLQTLKRSSDVRDQDVFACMLHSLFDEYRFFSDYPLSALSITAVLFGSLIQNQLLSYIPLGIALRYILDAVGHEPDSNMFKFGVQALNHFKDRVPAWPQYCQQILAIPSLAAVEPDLVAFIRTGDQRKSHVKDLEFTDSIGMTAIPSQKDMSASTKSPFKSLYMNLSSSGSVHHKEPPMDISDKILFNINNMSLTNLSEKLDEVKSVLVPQYHPWFATHLVSQRAAVEPNYHSLYIHFLEAMQEESLLHRVILDTIENIGLLLNSDNTITSTVERTNLKNLGSWLGGLTLARNKPLKHKLISLKDLLLEGFDGNRLIVVLPFVCRVLEQTIDSKVFRPPCPWTMAVLGLLMELYENADMKLNLKFEVEVLCKKLQIQMTNIPVSSVLRNRPLVSQEPEYLAEGLDDLNIREETTGRTAGDPNNDHNTAFVTAAIAEMPISIHPIIQQNFAVPNLQRLLMAASERAVREFILPVVERSVAVASISTSQLVSKDFALEEDLSKFQRAAHVMNQNLAGSLALVTCKEPLRGAITANLRLLLAQTGFEGLSPEGETLLAQLVSDNLEGACMIVEKAATERAISEIDEGLATGYQARRTHIESRNGQNFADLEAPRHAFSLPNPLRLKSSGLTIEQMATYDEFSRIPRTALEAATYYAKDDARLSLADQEHASYRNEQHSASTFEQVLSNLTEVDTLARDSNLQSIDELPEDSMLRSSMQQIPMYLSSLSGTLRDDRSLTCSQRVCQLLFKVPYQELAAQCLTLLLNHFIELSLKTYRDVSIWLVHSEDPRKYNVPVIQNLMRAQIIVPSEFDVQLAKQIVMRKSAAIDFAIGLLSEVILGPAPIALRSDFTSTLDALAVMSQTEEIHGFAELRGNLNMITAIDDNVDEDSYASGHLREQLSLIFMEWVHLTSHPACTEKVRIAYLLQLQKAGITTNDELASFFFRCMIEQSIESANRMMPASQSSTTTHYLVVDAAAGFIVQTLKFQSTTGDVDLAAHNLRRTLDIVMLCLIREHDTTSSSFNQKPYFRLFSSIICELYASEIALGRSMTPLFLVICEVLQNLEPSNYPGFTFSWVTLISHRLFMPKLLSAGEKHTWPQYAQLLCSLLSSVGLSLTARELATETRVIYNAILRILLVLLNDFPSFLDEFHYNFMNVIPDGCVQLRNLILSSFPRKMLLPDPFLPGLKVDRLPETAHAPRIWTDLESVLANGKVLSHVHNYIYSLNTAMIAKVARSLIKNKENTDESAADRTMLNTLVLHCGVQAMGPTSAGPPVFEVGSPWVSLLHELFKYLGPIGRYRMLGAIANQLRYPNSHTYFFSCVLLLLFSNGGDSDALSKEQITRVLLERLICNRPHPWGLLITFTELLKNSKYGFWELKFIRTSPEIETLFQQLFSHINQNIVNADHE